MYRDICVENHEIFLSVSTLKHGSVALNMTIKEMNIFAYFYFVTIPFAKTMKKDQIYGKINVLKLCSLHLYITRTQLMQQQCIKEAASYHKFSATKWPCLKVHFHGFNKIHRN